MQSSLRGLGVSPETAETCIVLGRPDSKNMSIRIARNYRLLPVGRPRATFVCVALNPKLRIWV